MSNRERFEEWYLAEFWEGSNDGRAMLKKEPCGGYTYAKPQELWKAWQAAQPAAGEPMADIRSAFENAWAQAMCNDEGVPGPRPLRSLVDPEEYRGGGVKFAWRWFQRGAHLAAPTAAAHGDEAVRKDSTEALMQRACAELPEDWYIEIRLENGSGYATLFNDGIVVDFGQDFESMGAQVRAAIDAAMRAQAGEGGE